MDRLASIVIMGLAAGWCACIFKRKNGIGGVFYRLRSLPLLRLVFKCEPCTIFWLTTAIYALAGLLLPFPLRLFDWLAVVAVAQGYAAQILFAVSEDAPPN